jgi:hypothetical protein
VRTFLGFLVAAITLASALYLHEGAKFGSYRYDTGYTASGRYVRTEAEQEQINAALGKSQYDVQTTVTGTGHDRAPWQNPVALFIAVAGVGAAVGIIVRR